METLKKLMSAVAVTLISAAAVIVCPTPAMGESDIVYTNTAPFNDRRVYLSAAYHGTLAGARGECQGRVERNIARTLSSRMASYMVDWGYRVRAGRGDPGQNAGRSNTWGSGLHMPLHSNAGNGSGTCANRGGATRGMWQIYKAGDPTGLSNYVVNYMDNVTPGSNDRICTVTVCTSYNTLLELEVPDAPRKTYSESEFHDWNPGASFLIQENTFRYLLAVAIDNAMGNPR